MFFAPSKEILKLREQLLEDVKILRGKGIEDKELIKELDKLGWKSYTHMFGSWMELCYFIDIKEEDYTGIVWRS